MRCSQNDKHTKIHTRTTKKYLKNVTTKFCIKGKKYFPISHSLFVSSVVSLLVSSIFGFSAATSRSAFVSGGAVVSGVGEGVVLLTDGSLTSSDWSGLSVDGPLSVG